MRTFKGKPPEVETIMDRKQIDIPEIRVFAITNELNDLVNHKDWRYRSVGKIHYHEHSLLTKSNNYPYPYEVVPVLNLGYLESRTIEEGPEQDTHLDSGYVRITGLVQTKCIREQIQGNLVRIIYEVISVVDNKMINYTVTDTYIDIEVKDPEFTFISKMT